MDTDSFIVHIKTEDFYEDIAADVEKRYDTSNYEFNRPLPAGKIMIEFFALRPKTYFYLMRDDYDNSDDDNTNKMAKGTKKCVIN